MKVNMDREGLPYNTERNMSYNSRLAQELAKWAETKGKAEEVTNALFRAYFVDVKNIGKADVLSKSPPEENDLLADVYRRTAQPQVQNAAADDDWRNCAAIGQPPSKPTFLCRPLSYG
jgi:predicted DsbA family dithiol-disulfide isomerase